MKIWGCVGCKTGYRLRIFTCPRCKGTEFKEEELMPKITVGGVSGVSPESNDDTEMPESPPTIDEVPETAPEPPATLPGDDLPSQSVTIVAPRRNASKAEWVEFATDQGAEDADQYTRDELALWWESTAHATKLEITAEAEVS